MLRRDPRQLGLARSRWRLADLLAQFPHWHVTTPSGMTGLLSRLGISYQRGRDYVHSPDPDYAEKMEAIATVMAQVRACNGRLVGLYLDELTYYRQPTLASAYAAKTAQPRARRSHTANTSTRVVATLDARDGRVVAWQGSRVDVAQLVRFYQELRQQYPAAARLYVVLDNWPVHFHPDVLVALEPQETRFPYYLPKHWSPEPTPRARRKWGGLALPIQLLPLPTYASWENPIEKLWRWGKQQVLHLHPMAERLSTLRETFGQFLAEFQHGSQALLRYVGLPVLD